MFLRLRRKRFVITM